MTRRIAPGLLLCLLAAPSAQAAGAEAAPVAAFRAECAAKYEAAVKADTMTVAGADGWLFFHNELRHLSVGEFWGEKAVQVSRATAGQDPLPAILDYQASCRKLGIELVLLPVPPKAIVYADKLSDEVKPDARGVPPRLDIAHQAFYKLLREKGVTVLDLTDDLLAARAEKGSEPVFCKQDTHWSGRACGIAARKIAELVQGRDWVKAIPRKTYDTQATPVQISGDLWRAMKGTKPPAESVTLRLVGTKGALGPTPIEPDPASPVLLLGDSHGLVFHMGGEMHATGAGLVDQMAFEFGCPMELIAVMGSGATPARISLYRKQRRIEGYLKTKKLIVWCFAAREFTESSGWREVPVTREN
ncbi:MAG TPA: hypothetical protein VM695_14130 [Phycisphaerae bacterium]|nr:hypothetical protein [Phycisphaerae bacterium]